MLGAVLTSIGLVFDIIGVALVWKFGLPDLVQREARGHFFAAPPPASELERSARYVLWSRIGLSLLIVGFALQMAGVWMPSAR